MTEETVATAAIIAAEKEDSKNMILDDEAIMELAKRRLAIKKNLIGQTIDYCMILLLFLLAAVIWDYGTKVLLCLIFALAWGGRLLYRIIKFARPSFKDGIAAYLKKRNDYKIESEFNRLKAEYQKQS